MLRIGLRIWWKDSSPKQFISEPPGLRIDRENVDSNQQLQPLDCVVVIPKDRFAHYGGRDD